MDEPKTLVAEHARALGLRVLDPYVLRDHHNVLVHLRPSPVLARLPGAQPMGRDAGAHMRNEVSVVRFLAERGAPVAPLSGQLDPGPHDIGQTLVSYWAYIDHQTVEDPFAPGGLLLGVTRCCAAPTSSSRRLAEDRRTRR